MADGSVTIKVDMDGSNAQSGISKLKSMFGSLESTGQKVGSVFKSVLGANLIGSALSSGVGAITGGIREMASELNSSQKAWKTFEGNLQAFGRSSEEIKAAKTEMQDFATKTIYSASDMANTYSQLDAVGVKNVGSLVKAFGGLAASAENPAQAMKSLSTQATQMASKPKVAWMDFKIMMEQAPAGMAAVAKEMGMSTADLVKAVQDGKVKTEDFFDAMNKAGNSDAFQKMATEFKTVDQAIDGAKESLSNKLMPAFDKLNSFGIKAVNAISDALDKINFDSVADKLGAFLEGIDIDGFISTITGAFAKAGEIVSEFFAVFNKIGVFEYISDTIRDIGVTAMSVFSELTSHINRFDNLTEGIGNIIIFVNKVIQDLAAGIQFALEAFSNTGAIKNAYQAFKDLSEAALDLYDKLSDSIPWEAIGEAAGHVVNAISSIVSWIAKLSKSMSPEAWKTVIITIGTVLATFKTLSFLESFNPFGLFAKKATEGVDEVVKGATKSKSLITKIFNGIGTIIKSLGQGISTAAKGLGSGLSTAFKGLGQGISTAAQGIGKGISIIAQGLAKAATMASPAQWLSMGAALLMVGAGVALVAGGFYILAQAAIQLGSAGTGAQIAMVALVVGIAALAGIFALLAPALTAGAVGLLAFGATVLLIGAGVAVAALAIATLVDAFANGFALIVNTISSNAPQIISIIQAIADGIRLGMDGIATVFTSVGESISTAAQGIGIGIESALNGVSTVISSVGTSINTALQGIATVFTSVGESISTAAQGIGKAIETVFNGISTVITSTGDAIRTILDGIANVFESVGNAAKNAGQGVKLMAEGIMLLVGLNLADLAGTLTTLAAGLFAIAHSGIAGAGDGLQQAGTGLMLIATSAQLASVSIQTLPTALSSLSTSINQLPSSLTTAGTAISTFTTLAVASFSSLSVAVPGITVLQSALVALSSALMATMSATSAMVLGFSAVNGVISALGGVLGTIPSLFSAISTSAMTANTSIMQLATSAPTVASSFANISSSAVSAMSQLNSVISSAMAQAVSQMSSSMQQMTNVVRQSASQMTQAGQQAGRGVSTGITNGIRSGIGSATSAMSSMVNSIQSAGMRGVSTMRYVGSMISQGLASGMYSALGAVTAAANAIVAQAERAARARARIHSPSRLFRDNVGRYIAQGIAVGIEENTSDVTDSLAYVQKEMSAFKFDAEDLLGLGNNTLSQSLKMSLGLAQAKTEKSDSGTNAEINNQYTFNYHGNKVDETEKRDIQRLMKEMAWYTNREQERLGGI
nr:MAG TPA: tail tape measure [Caudoviricetes sp.]